MKYGFVLPRGDARIAANYAREAEQAGWDGFFVWDPVWGIDPWVALSAAAMLTDHIRLGTMLTPPSRRRPWKLAGETATLDNLSGGRLILSFGLGATDTGFDEFGEITDRKERAELMDECLDILTGLWRGQPFSYQGKHYIVKPTKFFVPPPPVQQPRIPIWIVGAWGYPKSMKRALKYDGLLPAMKDNKGMWRTLKPADIQEILPYIRDNRKETTPFDIVVEGVTPGEDREKAAISVQPWIEAGATWWIEGMRDAPDLKSVLNRIRQGPPWKS